jgi:hypothetical protein
MIDDNYSVIITAQPDVQEKIMYFSLMLRISALPYHLQVL